MAADKRWVELEKILGIELLAKLLNSTEQSLKSYGWNPAEMPSHLEDRLSLLAAIVENLKGSYAEEDLKDWFSRKRHQLKNRAPIDFLKNDWWPRDPEVLEVLRLAKEII